MSSGSRRMRFVPGLLVGALLTGALVTGGERSSLAAAGAGQISRVAPGQISRVAPGQKEVALVFAADSWPGRISTILATLRNRNTKLTFFLTASYLTNFPDQARAISSAGHEIASHGYDQLDYRDLSDEQIARRLQGWRQAFRELSGKRGPAFWMAPYGYTDERVRQTALDGGYSTIYWTLDSLDAVGRPKSRTFILDRVLKTSWVSLDGAIVLLHPNSNGTVEALDALIGTLQQRGLRVVTVSELLKR